MADAEGEKGKRKAQRKYQEPIKYEIGKDLTQQEYEDILVKITDWLPQWRNTDGQAGALARHLFKCCLDGRTTAGEKWWTAATASLASRVRMLCRFDIVKGAGITKGTPKYKERRERAKVKDLQKKLKDDSHIPDLTKKELGRKATYGADLHALLTDEEATNWRRYFDAYAEQFPELKTVNGEAELSMLCDLHIVHDRNRLRLLDGKGFDSTMAERTTKQMVQLKSALGIMPDQLAKRVVQETAGTIGEAVKRMEQVPRELRERWFVEEVLILFQMYHMPSPRGDTDGWQLDEIGLFAATKCRTCACAKCGHRNFVGISIEEIEAYLVSKGVLRSRILPVIDPNADGHADA